MYEIASKDGTVMEGTLSLSKEQAKFLANLIGSRGTVVCYERTVVEPAKAAVEAAPKRAKRVGPIQEPKKAKPKKVAAPKKTTNGSGDEEGEISRLVEALGKSIGPMTGIDLGASAGVDPNRIPLLSKKTDLIVKVGKARGTKYDLVARAEAGGVDWDAP